MFVKIVENDTDKTAWYNKAFGGIFKVCDNHSSVYYIVAEDVVELWTSVRSIPKDLCEVVELENGNDARIKDLEYELEKKNEELTEAYELCVKRLEEIEKFKEDQVKFLQQKETNIVVKSGYEPLYEVLMKALNQAQTGKGDERHAAGRDFMKQPIMSIPRLLQSDNGLVYQVIKKMQESSRMSRDAMIKERLGAINYIAASILYQQN